MRKGVIVLQIGNVGTPCGIIPFNYNQSVGVL
jgi:hypothetical protein